MSPTRRVLVGFAALLVLFVVGVLLLGELLLRPAVERQVADSLASQFDLADRPSVSLGGFPIVVDLAGQQARDVRIGIRGETFSGLRVEAIDVRLEQVSFSLGDVVGGSGEFHVVGGDGAAVITAADLTDYLRTQGLPIEVSVEDGSVGVRGRITVAGVSAAVSANGRLEVVDNELRFSALAFDLGPLSGLAEAAAVAARTLGFTAPLPDLEGIRLTDLTLGDGRIEVAAHVEELTVRY
jgi:hypothetical protein